MGVMTQFTAGWWSLSFDYHDEDDQGPVGPFYRRSHAEAEARDWHHSHVAYFDGRQWVERHTGIFTVVSVLRQYVLRRVFDGRSPWQAIKGCVSRVSTLR